MNSGRRQSGQGLVELLVGMTVSLIVITALLGVAYAASAAYAQWSAPIARTSASNALSGLVIALRADMSRYQLCSGQGQDVTALNLCLPNQSGSAFPVSYTVPAGETTSPFEAVRAETFVGQNVLAADLPGKPVYEFSCTRAGTVSSGWIHVAVSDTSGLFASAWVPFRSPIWRGAQSQCG